MNICIINTGGTISSVGKPLAPMTAVAFGNASVSLLNPILKQQFPDIAITYESDLKFTESSTNTLDSTNLQPTDWCLMASYILENYSKYDGFVILHGTDSMDFTGSALPFLLNRVDANGLGTAVLSKPVIITGSQVPMYYQAPSEQSPNPNPLFLKYNTDAFQNVCGAIACAQFCIPEVAVYFDSQLYRGNRVVKVNASEFRAFNSPNYAPLAQIGINPRVFSERLLAGPANFDVSLDNSAVLQIAKDQLAAINASINSFPVMQFNAFPANYNSAYGSAFIADLINACVAVRSSDPSNLSVSLKGLILESYGEGNFPSGNPDNPTEGAIFNALNTANQNGVIIIDSTQVISGTVNDAAYASGAWLSQVGAIPAADMTPIASLAKTTILAAAAAYNNWALNDVKSLLKTDLQGELTVADDSNC